MSVESARPSIARISGFRKSMVLRMPSPKMRCDLDLIFALLCIFRELPFVRSLRSGCMAIVTHLFSHRPCTREDGKAIPGLKIETWARPPPI